MHTLDPTNVKSFASFSDFEEITQIKINDTSIIMTDKRNNGPLL